MGTRGGTRKRRWITVVMTVALCTERTLHFATATHPYASLDPYVLRFDSQSYSILAPVPLREEFEKSRPRWPVSRDVISAFSRGKPTISKFTPKNVLWPFFSHLPPKIEIHHVNDLVMGKSTFWSGVGVIGPTIVLFTHTFFLITIFLFSYLNISFSSKIRGEMSPKWRPCSSGFALRTLQPVSLSADMRLLQPSPASACFLTSKAHVLSQLAADPHGFQTAPGYWECIPM